MLGPGIGKTIWIQIILVIIACILKGMSESDAIKETAELFGLSVDDISDIFRNR